jgi:hypothetical protein
LIIALRLFAKSPRADMPFSVFPVNDTDAANAWLVDESNHDFREWDDASLEDQNKWAELEAFLSAVTGFKTHSIIKIVKDAIPNHLPVENLMVRATLEQKRKIAEQAATAILNGVNTDWKDASEEWLMDALLTFTRRVIKLWKKGLNRKVERSKPDKLGEGSSSSSSAKRRKVNARQEGGKESYAKGNDLVIDQSPKDNSPLSGQLRFDKLLQPSQHSQNLDTFSIEVTLKDGTCIPIAVSAIVGDRKRDCSSSDIRAEHLDFEKLLAIVRATDDSWDSKTWEMRWGKDQLQIHDGEDFTNAIGVMHFCLEQLCLRPKSKMPKSSDDVSMD